MDYNNHREEEKDLPIDYLSIGRVLIKNSLYILMLAFTFGIFFYGIWNHLKLNEYVSKINMVVISRDNSPGTLSDYNINNVVSRCVSSLNSDVLVSRVIEELGTESLPGHIHAERVENSNMILLTAQALSANEVFRIMNAALKNYAKVLSYVSEGYMLEKIGTPLADNIILESNNALILAILVFILMIIFEISIISIAQILNGKVQNSIQAKKLIDTEFMGEIHFEKKNKQKSILLSNPMVSFIYSEEINKVATRVMRKLEKSQDKMLMVTSLLENEGKSTTSANLALKLASRGKKVLLLDMDFKKPALFKILDKEVPENRDIISFLENKSSYEDIIFREAEGLFNYCISTKSMLNSDRLMAQDKVKELLKRAEEEMDYVILDAPPAGILRDVEVLASVVPKTILVIRQNRAKARNINDIIDVLERGGTEVTGFVLNAICSRVTSTRNSKTYGYKKHYNKYYSDPSNY